MSEDSFYNPCPKSLAWKKENHDFVLLRSQNNHCVSCCDTSKIRSKRVCWKRWQSNPVARWRGSLFSDRPIPLNQPPFTPERVGPCRAPYHWSESFLEASLAVQADRRMSRTGVSTALTWTRKLWFEMNSSSLSGLAIHWWISQHWHIYLRLLSPILWFWNSRVIQCGRNVHQWSLYGTFLVLDVFRRMVLHLEQDHWNHGNCGVMTLQLWRWKVEGQMSPPRVWWIIENLDFQASAQKFRSTSRSSIRICHQDFLERPAWVFPMRISNIMIFPMRIFSGLKWLSTCFSEDFTGDIE